jgi:hypothetical protein
MTHDYKRHGTTTLFAALNVLEGTVIGRCMQQHRHEEFISFLNDVERAVPSSAPSPPATTRPRAFSSPPSTSPPPASFGSIEDRP